MTSEPAFNSAFGTEGLFDDDYREPLTTQYRRLIAVAERHWGARPRSLAITLIESFLPDQNAARTPGLA
jgi:hypothetical protein